MAKYINPKITCVTNSLGTGSSWRAFQALIALPKALKNCCVIKHGHILATINPFLHKQAGCFMLLCKLPVIWSHSTIYQSTVFGDHFYLVYTVLIVKNRFLFLLCCKYDSIGSCKKNDDHWLDLTKMIEVKTQVTLYYRDNLPLQQLFSK